MILIDHVAGNLRTSPESLVLPPLAAQSPPRGSATVIILERDGSLHHYPPAQPTTSAPHALMELHEEQAQPSILTRIIEFTFDRLGISNLEVRIHEHPQG
jgi:hypothetical protein